MQAIGRQANAESYGDAELTAPDADGNPLPVADAMDVDPSKRGHVQDALNLGILRAEIVDGMAYIHPQQAVTRAEFAEFSVRSFSIVPFPN